MPPLILNEKWELKKCIGKGTFSEIFTARCINPPGQEEQPVAIKIQNQGFDLSVIRWEGEVLKALNNVNTVPRFFHYGQQNKQDYLVMELMGGEDMAGLRNRVRTHSDSLGLVPLPGAVYLAGKMVNCVKSLHQYGYIHRDIKPSNFVRRSKSSTDFCMIDFGLAKQYKDLESGKIRPKKDKAEFRGTAQYASPFVHEGADQAPRDDLFSIMYVFLDLLCGHLPWTEDARTKDKPAVTAKKIQYRDKQELLVKWVTEHVDKAEQPLVAAGKICLEDSTFPPHAQRCTLKLLEYLKELKYEDVPDYDRVGQLLCGCAKASVADTEEGEEPHYTLDMLYKEVGRPDYIKRGFNWASSSDKHYNSALLHDKSGHHSSKKEDKDRGDRDKDRHKDRDKDRDRDKEDPVAEKQRKIRLELQALLSPKSVSSSSSSSSPSLTPAATSATTISATTISATASENSASLSTGGSNDLEIEVLTSHSKLGNSTTSADGADGADGACSITKAVNGDKGGNECILSTHTPRTTTDSERLLSPTSIGMEAHTNGHSSDHNNCSSSSNNSNSSSNSSSSTCAVASIEQGPMPDFSIAWKWKTLVAELQTLPEKSITRETVDVFLEVIEQHNGFFHCTLDEESPENVAKFVEVINVGSGFYDLYQRVYKRPREVITFHSTMLMQGINEPTSQRPRQGSYSDGR